MAKTTTAVSRMNLDHPDFGHDASDVDSDLHTAVRAGWTAIGDNLNSRFFTHDALANSASQDFEHNFQIAFADLDVHMYLRNTGTGALTKLDEDSTPKRSELAVIPKVGSETTHITVTNNSGSARDIALVVQHGSIISSGSLSRWNAPSGAAPVSAEEYSQEVWKFPSSGSQEAHMWYKVPKSYVPGTQIKAVIALYSPSAANTILLQSTTYLVRKDTDAIDSTTNSHASGNSALTNTVAKQYREAELPLTDSSGLVNSVVVQPRDILKVKMVRGTDTDTEDIRFVLGSTEIKFS